MKRDRIGSRDREDRGRAETRGGGRPGEGGDRGGSPGGRGIQGEGGGRKPRLGSNRRLGPHTT